MLLCWAQTQKTKVNETSTGEMYWIQTGRRAKNSDRAIPFVLQTESELVYPYTVLYADSPKPEQDRNAHHIIIMQIGGAPTIHTAGSFTPHKDPVVIILGLM